MNPCPTTSTGSEPTMFPRRSPRPVSNAKHTPRPARWCMRKLMQPLPPRPSFSIRPAAPGDERALFALIQALAEYEKLSHAVTGSAEQLAQDLFQPRPRVE